MTHFVPYKKMSKKAQKAYNNSKRKDWGTCNPCTKFVPNKKKSYDFGWEV